MLMRLEQLGDGPEPHRPQEMDQLLFHLRDPDVVAQAPEERRLNRWVPGVQLPGVDVDDSMPAVPFQTTKKRIRQIERIRTQISPPSERDPERTNRPDG
jgi:hypothetical protein